MVRMSSEKTPPLLRLHSKKLIIAYRGWKKKDHGRSQFPGKKKAERWFPSPEKGETPGSHSDEEGGKRAKDQSEGRDHLQHQPR